MTRFLALLFLAVLAATSIDGFTIGSAVTHKLQSSIARTTSTPGAASPFASSANTATAATAMHMVKIKVDPNAKEERVNPAVFKNALYLGSIAVAVLLPVFFLIAASK